MPLGQNIPIPAGSDLALVQAIQNVERYIGEQMRAPVFLPSFTVAELGALPASKWLNHAVRCPDESGGATIAVSDGTDWLRVSDGAPVS